MNQEQVFFLTIVLLGTVGLALLLRTGRGPARIWGAALSAITFGFALAQAPVIGPIMESVVFYVLAALTVLSALATISLVHPLYCAACFGLTLVGTSALMAYQGAQFLAAATLLVYVGAILVVLLFVLMLAHPRGRAPYDWNRWEVFVSSGTGMVLLAMLSLLIGRTLAGPEKAAAQVSSFPWNESTTSSEPGEHRSEDLSSAKSGEGILGEDHVARIGQHLFGEHLLAVQGAGVLLLAALVGTALILSRMRGPSEEPLEPSDSVSAESPQEPPPRQDGGKVPRSSVFPINPSISGRNPFPKP